MSFTDQFLASANPAAPTTGAPSIERPANNSNIIPMHRPKLTQGFVGAVGQVSRPDDIQQTAAAFGMPAANENVRIQGTELTLAQALNENPVFQQIRKESICNLEIMLVVKQTLNFVFSGNKMMHVPPDEMRELMDEIGKQVAEYKAIRETNPNSDINLLRHKIGPGSAFAQKRKMHLERHHPSHPYSHEPNGGFGGKPDHTLFGLNRDVHGTLSAEHFHNFGQPNQ